jgi:hypothetical protein
MMIVFCVLFSLLYSISSAANIGVCISGHIVRWLPRSLLTNLIAPNPHHKFHLFINLEHFSSGDISTLFQKQQDLTFTPSPVVDMSARNLFLAVHQLYDTNNSQVISLEFQPRKTHQSWVQWMGQPLDRITQFKDNQEIILNLYSHQVSCADQILLHEETTHNKMDYIIFTREDIYLLKPFNLDDVLPGPRVNLNPSDIHRSPHNDASSPEYDYCHLVTKDCLSWQGVEMRFEITERKDLFLLRDRIKFYRSLYQANTQVWNPEQFEKFQLHSHNLNYCEVRPTRLPAVPVRAVAPLENNKNSPVKEGEFPEIEICIVSLELRESCYPPEFEGFLKNITCRHHK